HVGRPAPARGRPNVHGDDGGGRRRPGRPASRAAPEAEPMTADVVDAGDGLPLTIPALLAARAHERGEHPLLICDDDVLTYADAAARSAALAKGLLAIGAGRGTH